MDMRTGAVSLLAMGLLSCAELVPDAARPGGAGSASQALLTSSEVELVRATIQPCWTDKTDRQDVRLRVIPDAEGRVSYVEVIDKAHFESDSGFRAASQAAISSLLNPGCSSLPFSPERVAELMPGFVLTLRARP